MFQLPNLISNKINSVAVGSNYPKRSFDKKFQVCDADQFISGGSCQQCPLQNKDCGGNSAGSACSGLGQLSIKW